MMRNSYRIILLILGMFPLMSTLAFSVPGLISYKGQLTAASGGPITTSVDVTFTLWDAETGGNQLGSGFSDTDSVTPNADGIYDTLIGDDGGDMIPGSIFGNNSVWLNVNVDGEDLSPRTRLTPVGAALQAGDADTVDGLEGTDLEESAELAANTNSIAAEENRAQAAEATLTNDLASEAATARAAEQANANAIAGNTSLITENSSISGKPFLGRSIYLYTGSSSWSTVDMLPLSGGNHLTPTHIKVEGRSNNSENQAEIQYVLHYSDGTASTSNTYYTASDDAGYVVLFESGIPTSSNLRGSITSLQLKLRQIGIASPNGVYGRLTISGYETEDSGLTVSKPFFGRTVQHSNDGMIFTSTTMLPMSGGYHLTPTHIKVEGKSTGSLPAHVRYVLNYADGTSLASDDYSAVSSEYGVLFEHDIPVHDNIRSSITGISLQVRSDHISPTYIGHGRLTISGYETAP